MFFGDGSRAFFRIGGKRGTHEILNLRMDELAVGLGFEIFERAVQGIVLTFIHLAGRDHVADHFTGIFEWNDAAIAAGYVAIDPIFPVVSVASLVMQPGFAVAVEFTAYCQRRTVSIVIFHAFDKFGRGKFTQVVQHAAKRNACAAAEFKNFPFVVGYQTKMLPYILIFHNSFLEDKFIKDSVTYFGENETINFNAVGQKAYYSEHYLEHEVVIKCKNSENNVK